MGFSISNFINTSSMTPVEKIVSNVVGSVLSGSPISLQSVATSMAQSLFNIGASYDSVNAVTALKTDTLISRGASDFFAQTGKDPIRASAADISAMRTTQSSRQAFVTTNPNAKIDQSNNDQFDIMTVIV